MYELKGQRGFAASYRGLVLDQTLIITTQRSHEQQAMDPFKTVNPFLPLRALPSYIKHVVGELAEIEQCLCNTSSSKT